MIANKLLLLQVHWLSGKMVLFWHSGKMVLFGAAGKWCFLVQRENGAVDVARPRAWCLTKLFEQSGKQCGLLGGRLHGCIVAI